ncbi:hypothetical protein [Geomonas anaerohicana]|uniref:Uncharacterized protein n=1 Tax=Geomonas anaerohicana TaxID=2798583 RepID=A0ABS0YLC2_9BACT|nr:hypothetical protein [Geomonas anaerohicana]MBJ6752687.1 hypothetical protein [Geomonas anaerohicana]
MAKSKMNQRLPPEVFERLMQMQESQKLSMGDLISSALDALEREVYLPETLLERVENLEVLALSIIEKVGLLDQKTLSADKIKYFFQVLEKQLVAHDQTEHARFERIAGPRCFD